MLDVAAVCLGFERQIGLMQLRVNEIRFVSIIVSFGFIDPLILALKLHYRDFSLS